MRWNVTCIEMSQSRRLDEVRGFNIDFSPAVPKGIQRACQMTIGGREREREGCVSCFSVFPSVSFCISASQHTSPCLRKRNEMEYLFSTSNDYSYWITAVWISYLQNRYIAFLISLFIWNVHNLFSPLTWCLCVLSYSYSITLDDGAF